MSKRIQSSTMAIANTFAFSGIEAVPVEVQVQITPGAPGLVLVGQEKICDTGQNVGG